VAPVVMSRVVEDEAHEALSLPEVRAIAQQIPPFTR
jgi:hypothetical protein